MNLDKATFLSRDLIQRCNFEQLLIKQSEDQPEEDTTHYDLLIEDNVVFDNQMMELLKIVDDSEIDLGFIIGDKGILIFQRE